MCNEGVYRGNVHRGSKKKKEKKRKHKKNITSKTPGEKTFTCCASSEWITEGGGLYREGLCAVGKGIHRGSIH